MSEPDIFLSYNREDTARAKQFADGFAEEGFDVWWDVALRSGEAYDEVTENALRNAKAVVVLWSPRSVVSRWVRAEATLADRNKTLVPAMIEPCRRPIMFELTQTAELSHWKGDARDHAWQEFIKDVRGFVGREAPAAAFAAAPAVKARPERAAKQSIVVLPFTNMGGDPEQEYFADGITEDIITDLSKVSALAVISRNTAFTFKGMSHDVRHVAEELGVSHVLEGSVRRAGNRVRITAQLIEGKSDEHVWADRFDRDLEDIFELQDELSKAIVSALKLKLMPQEQEAIADRGTTSIEAHDLYLRARSVSNAAMSISEADSAKKLIRRALVLDPDFAPAKSLIAGLLNNTLILAPERHEEVIEELDELCKQAVARTPESWGTKVLLGFRLQWARRWQESLEALEQATAAAPSLDTEVADMFALALADVGRVGEAIKVLEAVLAVDPLSRITSNYLQLCFTIANRLEEAEAEYRRARDASLFTEAIEHMAFFRIWASGDMGKAKQQFRRYLNAQTVRMPFMVDYAEVLDQDELSLEILRKAVDDPANQDATRLILIAGHLALHGDPELAVAAMRRATLEHKSRSQLLLWDLYRKDARQLPEFKQLIRDLGLDDYWRSSGNWGDFARPLGDDDFEIIG